MLIGSVQHDGRLVLVFVFMEVDIRAAGQFGRCSGISFSKLSRIRDGSITTAVYFKRIGKVLPVRHDVSRFEGTSFRYRVAGHGVAGAGT